VVCWLFQQLKATRQELPWESHAVQAVRPHSLRRRQKTNLTEPRFLDRLPAIDRKLIVSLFWEENTQVEVARMLFLSQQAISKRKRRILGQLRHWMGQLGKKELI
jgi:DNA-directed RNA polymerase specialized sigma subunit